MKWKETVDCQLGWSDKEIEKFINKFLDEWKIDIKFEYEVVGFLRSKS